MSRVPRLVVSSLLAIALIIGHLGAQSLLAFDAARQRVIKFGIGIQVWEAPTVWRWLSNSGTGGPPQSVFDPVGIRTFTAPCDVARVSLARSAVKYELVTAAAGTPAKVTFNGKDLPIAAAIPANITAFTAAATEVGYPKPGDPSVLKVNGFFSVLGGVYVIVLSQHIGNVVAQVGVVFHDQNRVASARY